MDVVEGISQGLGAGGEGKDQGDDFSDKAGGGLGLDEGQHLYAKQGGKYGHKKEFAIGDERKKREAQAMTRFPDFWMVSFLAKMPALIPPMIPPTVRAPWA